MEGGKSLVNAFDGTKCESTSCGVIQSGSACHIIDEGHYLQCHVYLSILFAWLVL